MFVDTATFSLRDSQPSCHPLLNTLLTLEPNRIDMELVELLACNPQNILTILYESHLARIILDDQFIIQGGVHISTFRHLENTTAEIFQISLKPLRERSRLGNRGQILEVCARSRAFSNLNPITRLDEH
jgi:hypothetical protein